MNPDDLLRLAVLLRLHGETVRLFSNTHKDGNGEISRITSLALQIDAIAVELIRLAKQLGASELPEAPDATT